MRYLLFFTVCSGVAMSQAIFDAVAQNSMAALKEALKAEPGALDTPGPGGQSPLMHAVLTGKPLAVKYLLRKGADVTVPEKDGYTPMHGAGFQGRAEIARQLIDHGIDPWDVHKDGNTPLQRACWGTEERHAQTVQVFVDAGATAEQLSKCEVRNEWTNAVVAKALKTLADKVEL